jgi:hypothetical protein
MNNQELIKKYEEILINGKSDFKSAHIYQTFLKELRQLDEPQKPVVPQFVADWIEYCKITHVDLQHALIVGDVYFYNYANQKDFSKLKEFLETENNQETFARAWLDGYTVEKEKRYLVKMKSIDTNFNFLNRHRNENYWIFSRKDKNTLYQTQHTRKELEEAGLGWVFDSPGIEVEEVEE